MGIVGVEIYAILRTTISLLIHQWGIEKKNKQTALLRMDRMYELVEGKEIRGYRRGRHGRHSHRLDQRGKGRDRRVLCRVGR